MDDAALLGVLHHAANAVREALDELEDWGPSGARPGQYQSDLVADAAAVRVLDDAGLGVLSEETALHHPDRPVLVALDPIDGSTNAAHGIPWFATSLCALDNVGLRAAVVVNQATGERYEAVRGGGARCNGRAIAPSTCLTLSRALVAVQDWPPRRLGWRQYRALGAAALDLCAVAAGRVDAFLDCGRDTHGPWDYLAAVLVCREAGAPVADAFGRDIVSRGYADRRTPVAAATQDLLRDLVAARLSFP
jgi:fructose-1,6-bisphosphatase/inositol monophosphatase family enzyme